MTQNYTARIFIGAKTATDPAKDVYTIAREVGEKRMRARWPLAQVKAEPRVTLSAMAGKPGAVFAIVRYKLTIP